MSIEGSCISPSEMGSEAGFGLRLRNTRISQGKSGRGLAKKAGISPAYLIALEQGKNPKTHKPSIPSADVRNRLFSALDIFAEETLRNDRKEQEESLRNKQELASQYQRVIRGIGEKGHFSDLYVEFSPGVGGVIKTTRVYGETSLRRESHFNELGELDQVDIFRRVRRSEVSNGDESETAEHLALKRGSDGRFFIDRQDMRPLLLEKWYAEHPKLIVPVKQLSRKEFSILLKTSLLEIGITQKKLAQEFGTNEQTVSRWVRAETQPDKEHIEVLFNFFHWYKNATLLAAFQSPEGLIVKRQRVRCRSSQE